LAELAIRSKKYLVEASDKGDAGTNLDFRGICFRTDNGRTLANHKVNKLAQEVVAEVVQDPEQLTTYSWRAYAESIAVALKRDPAALVALGDWQT